jgi:transcriptional regulator with XRE-family HTH domain
MLFAYIFGGVLVMTFGNRLRSLREDNDISTDDFAKIIHITPRALNYYETDMREPGINLIIKIANYFNVTTDYLLCRNNIDIPYNKLYMFIETNK